MIRQEDPWLMVEEELKAYDRAWLAGVEEQLDYMPAGQRAPTKEQLRLYIEQKTAKHPPQAWILPTGEVIWGSAFLLQFHLETVENGREWLARIRKATSDGDS